MKLLQPEMLAQLREAIIEEIMPATTTQLPTSPQRSVTQQTEPDILAELRDVKRLRDTAKQSPRPISKQTKAMEPGAAGAIPWQVPPKRNASMTTPKKTKYIDAFHLIYVYEDDDVEEEEEEEEEEKKPTTVTSSTAAPAVTISVLAKNTDGCRFLHVLRGNEDDGSRSSKYLRYMAVADVPRDGSRLLLPLGVMILMVAGQEGDDVVCVVGKRAGGVVALRRMPYAEWAREQRMRQREPRDRAAPRNYPGNNNDDDDDDDIVAENCRRMSSRMGFRLDAGICPTSDEELALLMDLEACADPAALFRPTHNAQIGIFAQHVVNGTKPPSDARLTLREPILSGLLADDAVFNAPPGWDWLSRMRVPAGAQPMALKVTARGEPERFAFAAASQDDIRAAIGYVCVIHDVAVHANASTACEVDHPQDLVDVLKESRLSVVVVIPPNTDNVAVADEVKAEAAADDVDVADEARAAKVKAEAAVAASRVGLQLATQLESAAETVVQAAEKLVQTKSLCSEEFGCSLLKGNATHNASAVLSWLRRCPNAIAHYIGPWARLHFAPSDDDVIMRTSPLSDLRAGQLVRCRWPGAKNVFVDNIEWCRRIGEKDKLSRLDASDAAIIAVRLPVCGGGKIPPASSPSPVHRQATARNAQLGGFDRPFFVRRGA